MAENASTEAISAANSRFDCDTDPNNPDTDGDGIPDGWEVYLGLNPTGNDSNNASSRANFDYTLADWLEGVSGIKIGSVTTDDEGNVTAVSQ